MARLDEEFERRWHSEAEAVMSGMKEWRLQHPKATFREIEAAVDEKLSGMRARLLEDLALASRAADLQDKQLDEQPRCPECGQVLEGQGKQERTVLTHGGGEVHLRRDYARCPACAAGLFPLDEELQLLPGPLSPRLQEDLVHLSTWMPFERAAKELAHFTRVEVSETSVRRHAELAGAAYVAVQAVELERLERERPAGPSGTDVALVSVDGAMVPLIGGEWAEVKTAAVGRVEVVINRDGVAEAHARDLSYFSRLADAETFTREAWVELHRAGIASAHTVCGVMDGAEWEQTFLDVHRPDAVRILDFPHAVEYLTRAAQATWCRGAPAADSWIQEQAHTLKHDERGAAQVLIALAHLPIQQATDPTAARQARDTALNYLTKRLDQIQYASF